MTEEDIIDQITEALYMYDDEHNPEHNQATVVRSFKEVGMLTTNSGFVLCIGDDEFQVTVTKK